MFVLVYPFSAILVPEKGPFAKVAFRVPANVKKVD
jgi:hypothetical protein